MRAQIELGFRLLLHDKLRLLSMSASVAVGVVIVFVELGLLWGILDSQALVATLARGQFLLMNASRADLHHWDKIPAAELAQFGGVPGVAKVMPVYEDHLGLTDPDGGRSIESHRIRRIIVYAFSPADMPLAVGDLAAISAELKMADSFVFDRWSRAIYGHISPGIDVELDKSPLQVSGLAKMGPDIVNDGNIFMSDGEWLKRRPDAQPIMGVVRLLPGADMGEVRKRLLASAPPDVRVMTPEEARERENNSTLMTAPIGLLFTLGMIAGLVIGTINCYQVLYTEVSDHLGQYATVKAMGFSDSFLNGVILTQALVLSGTGFATGLLISLVADALVASLTRLPIAVHPLSGTLVFLATAASCALAGWIAVRRVAAADPAALY
jgi:putative ABC transport system permease protein